MPALVDLDRAGLQKAVDHAVGRGPIELVEWSHERVHAAFNQATAGLYRVTGMGLLRGELIPWSVILKIVHASDDPFGGSAQPGHANYWKREALIYQSGLLDALPGIRAPRCHGIDEGDTTAAGIWLEDVLGMYLDGMTPEQIAAEYYTVSLEEAQAAVAYYKAHRAEVDA